MRKLPGGPYKHRHHAKVAAKKVYPHNDAAFTLTKDHNGWWWAPVQDRGTTHMNQVVPDQKAITPRPITRDDRRRIVDELDTHYDVDKQRYHGSMSDQKLGDQMKVPRIWITTIRTELYGDYDRNEDQEKNRAKALEVIGFAEKARDQLLEMASKAETILNDLRKQAGLT